MSFAVFNTYEEADAYNNAVHDILSENPLYIADKWAYIFEHQGKFYVDTHESVLAENVVPQIPNLNNDGL